MTEGPSAYSGAYGGDVATPSHKKNPTTDVSRIFPSGPNVVTPRCHREYAGRGIGSLALARVARYRLSRRGRSRAGGPSAGSSCTRCGGWTCTTPTRFGSGTKTASDDGGRQCGHQRDPPG